MGRLPESAFCQIEWTGHVAMIERPDTYNTLVRALVEAIRANSDLEAVVRAALDEN